MKYKHIIGIQFEKLNDGYLLHQRKYHCDILNRFDENNSRPISKVYYI